MKSTHWYLILAILALIYITACSGSSSSNSGETKTGRLSLSLTDAPVDNASAVYITFDAIELKKSGGPSEIFYLDNATTINLLTYQNGEKIVMWDNITLEAGMYNWFRLHLTDNNSIVIDNTTYELYIPSGDETGLKFNKTFIVPVNAEADFTIDFDLRKSIHKPENESDQYKLRPTIRVVDNTISGGIMGTIDDGLLTDNTSTCYVYIYDDNVAVADDLNGNNEPVTTAAIFPTDNETYRYKVGFLTANDYKISYTCDADDPEINETLIFGSLDNVTVTANGYTIHNID